MKLGEIYISDDKEIVRIREITKFICTEIGFNKINTIRITTATSELTRNLYEHALKGKITFIILDQKEKTGIKLIFEDNGPGIKNLDQILSGTYKSKEGLGIGLLGAKNLMDFFNIKTSSEGTKIEIIKWCDQYSKSYDVDKIKPEFDVISEESALSILKTQNRETLLILEELKEKNERLIKINLELKQKKDQLNTTMLELENSNYEIMETMTALEQLNKELETIVDTIPDAILVMNLEGTILLYNEPFKKLCKKCIEGELRIKTNILDYKNDNLFIKQLKESVTKTKELRKFIIEPKKGLWLQFLSNFTRISPSAEPFAIIIEIRDITQFVEFEEIRKQFVSTVSHELRTPITSINLSISNFKKYKEYLSEKVQAKILDMIEDNSIILNKMIDDLLILSRMDVKKIELQLEPCDMKELIETVIFQLSSKTESKNIKIINEIEPECVIIGDPVRLSQVFRILIDNAVKYSHENTSIYIKVDLNYIGTFNEKNQKGILFKVIDHGIGINPKDLGNIFQRFFRSENVKNIKGTGLGLSIAKEIISLHRGEIFVESEYGKGSTFGVFLPM